MTEKIGLEAVMNTDSFTRGMNVFTSGITAMLGAVSNFQARSQAGLGPDLGLTIARSLGTAAEYMHTLGGAADRAGFSLGNLGFIGTSLAYTVGNLLTSAITKGASALQGFIFGSVMAAGRAQEMDFVLQVLGGRIGKTADEMRSLVDGVVKYGVTTDSAQNLIRQMINSQLDLAKATDLARVAQDQAVLSGLDSSETLDRIVAAIQRYDTQMLRTAGINLNAQEAFRKYAEEIGKTASALSETEKQQAILNAVLEEGAKNAGLYAAAMESPTKQLRSFSRDMYELNRVAGAPFLNAFSGVVGAMRDTAQTFRQAIDEGGKLHETMIQLGAVAGLMGDGIRAGAAVASNAIITLLAGGADKFTEFANRALDWGVNVVTQFATGIIQGASSVLIAAMQFIASILAGWLAPGSPPRVAKGLPNWGQHAMEEWLKGFTNADFSILTAIQNPLKSALSVLQSAGKLEQADVGKVYARISKELASALAGDGNISKVLKDVTKSLGPFGEQIAKLVELQFNLAKNTEYAEEAQKRLAEAMQAEQTAATKVSDLTREYNELLREGADKKVLRTQLDRINAARKEQVEAAKQRSQYESILYIIQQQSAAYDEMIKKQQQLIDQLIDITRMNISPLDALAGGAGGLAGAGGGAVASIDAIAQLMKDKLQQAVEDAKEAIKTKLQDMFKPLKEAYERDWFPIIFKLMVWWNIFTTMMWILWMKYVDPVLKAIQDKVPWDEFYKNVGIVTGIVLVAIVIFGLLTAALTALAAIIFSPVGVLIGIILLIALLTTFKDQLSQTLLQIEVIILYYLNKWSTDLTNWLSENKGKIFATLIEVLLFFLNWGQNLGNGIAFLLWNIILPNVVNWLIGLMTLVSTKLDEIRLAFLQFWLDIYGQFVIWTLLTWLKIKSWVDDQIGKFNDLVVGLRSVKTAFGELITKIGEFISAVLHGDFKKALELLSPLIGHSPSPLAKGIASAASELRRLSQIEFSRASKGIRNSGVAGFSSQFAKASVPVSSTSNRTLVVNMNIGNIGNGMDMASFETRVKKIIRSEFAS